MSDKQYNSSLSEYYYGGSVSSSSPQSTCWEARQPEPSGTKRRKNERFTERQISLLERAYSEQKLEGREYQRKLASELNVSEERVKDWNINRKTKQKGIEKDNELRRLQAELQSYRMEIIRLHTIMNSNSCNCQIHQRMHSSSPLVTGPLPVNKAFVNHVLPANPLKQPMQLAPQGYLHANQQHNVDLLKSLPGVRNVCEAAYKEILKLAVDANLLIKDIPKFGSLEQTLKMFHGPPPSEMTNELSIETGIIPLAPLDVISIMVNVKKWASMLSNIVYRARDVFPSELQQLRSTTTEMKNIQMINAELHWLTPILQMRRYQFLRYWREVAPNIWAIVDISDEFLWPTSYKPSSEVRCMRRPSGLIIRKINNNCSQVIWIENVVVSSLITSNSAFCAKKWMVTLLHSVKRNGGNFFAQKVALEIKGPQDLLNSANLMRMAYFERVNGSPDESEWVITNDGEFRVMRKRTTYDLDALGLTTRYAACTFEVKAEPRRLFEFLSREEFLLKLQRLNVENTWGSEEICQLDTNDYSSIITLSKKGDAYFLKEVSRNEFCYYIISSPMSQSSFGFVNPTGQWSGTPAIPSGAGETSTCIS